MQANKQWIFQLICILFFVLSVSSCGGSSGGENDKSKASLVATPPLIVNENENYSFQISTVNFTSKPISYSAVNLPSWLHLDQNTGFISGVPTYNDAGLYQNISISATNGEQSASLTRFSIEVINVNRQPVLNSQLDLTVFETELYQSTFDILDYDGDSVSLSVLNIPTWASFDAETLTLSGTPSIEDAGLYEDIVVMANDGYDDFEVARYAITVKNSIVISGKVIDGYIKGALVFLDSNLNSQYDEGELYTYSGGQGEYSLIVTSKYYGNFRNTPIRAYIGEGAEDVSRANIDFSQTPVVLSALPLPSINMDMHEFNSAYITPFTHRVVNALEVDLIKLSDGVITLVEFEKLLENRKSFEFEDIFENIDVEINETELDVEALTVDVFGDFISSKVILPITYQALITELAKSYMDEVIRAQDVRDTDNDGILNYRDNDDDGDGVVDSADDFPLDSSESLDSDGDGIGNNADFYDNDPRCSIESDGNGEQCYFSWLAQESVSKITSTEDGLVYFYADEASKIVTYDSNSEAFLSPVSVQDVTIIEYINEHKRLYIGYNNGDIKYLSSDNTLKSFSHLNDSIAAIRSAGNYISVFTGFIRDQQVHLINDKGDVADTSDVKEVSVDSIAWSEQASSLYFLSGDVFDGNLARLTLNTHTGEFGELVELPKFNSGLSFATPFRVSPSASQFILGSGVIYDAESLGWIKFTGSDLKEAFWTKQGALFTLHGDISGTRLVRRDIDENILEERVLKGTFKSLIRTPNGIKLILKDIEGAYLKVVDYIQSDDLDADGVLNSEDAFPWDKAASVDSDNDGYPDYWHEGYSRYDTDLSLDEFPNDSACWLLEQGLEGVCDIASLIPDYEPEHISYAIDGMIYFLHQESSKIYRWSVEQGRYLNPLIINSVSEVKNSEARRITYSAKHNRVYVGYLSGTITFFDLSDVHKEHVFTNISNVYGATIYGLVDAGDFLFVKASTSNLVFDQSGTLTDSVEVFAISKTMLWNESLSRVYYLSDHSSRDVLHYSEIDQAFGTITFVGESDDFPDSSSKIRHPLRNSYNLSDIILGSGWVYDAKTLEEKKSLQSSSRIYFKDLLWGERDVFTIEHGVDASKVKVWSYEEQRVINYLELAGEPISFIPLDDSFVVMSKTEDGLVFSSRIYFDKDGDGLPGWWELLYNLDDTNSSDARLDSDGDGLANSREFQIETNPLLSDTDSDGLSDSEEDRIYLTSPILADTDQDGLSDGEEVNTYNTNPLQIDTDGDGLNDGKEVNEYETDPLALDSDLDGLSDYNEIFTYSSNPLSADTDNDGMSDKYEAEHSLNINQDDAQLDNDSDGLTNLEEFHQGTDPFNKDSDKDVMPDGFEVNNGLNPLLASDAWLDFDGDGESNVEEFYYDTDLRDASAKKAKSWLGYQGGASHNGYMPIQIDYQNIKDLWAISAHVAKSQIVTDLDKVFVTNRYRGQRWLSAHSVHDGSELWRKHFNDSDRIVTPAIHLDKIYVQTVLNDDALTVLDVETGQQIFKHDYGWSQFRFNSLAPVPYKESVYTLDGWNTIYAYDADGEPIWSYWLEHSSIDWTPAVNEDFVFILEKGLKVLKRFDGEVYKKIELPLNVEYTTGNGFNSSYKYNAPVIGTNNNVLAIQSDYLINYDIEGGNVLWYVPVVASEFQKQITVANGDVYAVHNDGLSVFDEKTGTLLWTWQPSANEKIASNIVVTDNAVIVGTHYSTYVVDIKSKETVSKFSQSGVISLSIDGVLFIANGTRLSAYSVQDK